jgi:hypothetical protein
MPVPELSRGNTFEVNLLFRDVFGTWIRFYFPFVFDTGAMFSIAPVKIMEKLGLTPVQTMTVNGISTKPECGIEVQFAKVTFKVYNTAQMQQTEFDGWFGFHDMKGPCILGLREILLCRTEIDNSILSLTL